MGTAARLAPEKADVLAGACQSWPLRVDELVARGVQEAEVVLQGSGPSCMESHKPFGVVGLHVDTSIRRRQGSPDPNAAVAKDGSRKERSRDMGPCKAGPEVQGRMLGRRMVPYILAEEVESRTVIARTRQ